MFQREKNQPAPQPIVVAPAWNDKALPVIPFSPDWMPAAATPEVSDEKVLPTAHAAQDDVLRVIFTGADAASAEMFRVLGEQWGYRVFAPDDGREALQSLRQISGAAIAVVDRKMGDIDAFEFCRAAHGLKQQSLYIILVTERTGVEQLPDALAAGADDYLITPFDADELRARLRVGARVIELQRELAARVAELDVASAKVQGFTNPAVVDPRARPLFGPEAQ